jgi:hypothetical protein
VIIDRIRELRHGWDETAHFSVGLRPTWLTDDSVRATEDEVDVWDLDDITKTYQHGWVSDDIDDPVRVYKAVDEGVAELIIPPGDTIVHPRQTGRMTKYRSECAYVVDMYKHGGSYLDQAEPIYSYRHDSLFSEFVYETGKWVRADELDTDEHQECSGGVNFFATQKEALHFR